MRKMILMSGGIESAAIAAFVVSKLPSGPVSALFVDYGQRAVEREERAANALCAHYGIYLTKVEMQIPFWKQNALLDPEVYLMRGTFDGPEETRVVKGEHRRHIVSFRNLIMLGLAASYADQLTQGDVTIFAGFDWRAGHPGAARDKSPAFVEAVNTVLDVGNENAKSIEVRAPFQGNTKAMTIQQMGDGVPWDLSWSCYNDYRLHCGVCAACVDRAIAFRELGMDLNELPEEERPE